MRARRTRWAASWGSRSWFGALALGLVASGCGGRPSSPAVVETPAERRYVGVKVCAGCHEREAALWEGSHHALAMQPADPATVLGAFDGRSEDHAGIRTTFTHDARGFHVRTDGPEGTLRDFEVAYTFGVDPLQQYLFEVSPSRYQALSLFWDTRPGAQGGGRWRHLHPDRSINHRDPLHWTGPYQNWNYMCAECHSTGLRRGYRIEEDRFQTTWAEIDVSCEACHGPGSRHVAWAADRSGTIPDLGLAVRLGSHDGGKWAFPDATGIARRTPPRSSQAELETCGLCHARRIPLVDGYVHGRPLADSHRLVLLDAGLYYPDGQILDEDYEYGSFLQSAMHHEGVTCTDCHDPHAAGKQPLGDGACARCHRSSRFASPAHHHHEPHGPGASCIGCHMPTRTYMVVDRRHDHSLRVPRPDLSLKTGSPNACTDCHRDRSATWAAEATARWYPNGRSGTFHYGEALFAGRTWAADRAPLLRRVTSDPRMPGIVRATALSLLARQIEPEDLREIDRSLADPDPIVRRAGVEALESLPDGERRLRARAIVSDPVRSVRLEAVRLLADEPLQGSGAPPDAVLEAGFAEYLASQRSNGDRAEAWLNMGLFHLRRGDVPQAERDYRSALARQPSFILASVNLADLDRIRNRDSEGEAVLRDALRHDPESAEVHYALGLLLVRRQRVDEGIRELARAAARGGEPQFPYALGIALSSAGRAEAAIETLESAYRRFPGYKPILFALVMLLRDRGDRAAAADYAGRLVALAPSDPEAHRLLAETRKTSMK